MPLAFPSSGTSWRGRSHALRHHLPSTILFVGEVLATSPRPHAFITNGLKKMSSAHDLKTAKNHSIRFSSPPREEDLATFMEKWDSALGVVRTRTKAGRIWKDVPDGKGGTCSVISLWGERRSIRRADIDLLARVFRVKGRLLVEAIDSRAPGHYSMPARGWGTREEERRVHPAGLPRRSVAKAGARAPAHHAPRTNTVPPSRAPVGIGPSPPRDGRSVFVTFDSLTPTLSQPFVQDRAWT